MNHKIAEKIAEKSNHAFWELSHHDGWSSFSKKSFSQ